LSVSATVIVSNFTFIFAMECGHLCLLVLTDNRVDSTESGWQVDRSVFTLRRECAPSQEWSGRTSCQVTWSSASQICTRRCQSTITAAGSAAATRRKQGMC